MKLHPFVTVIAAVAQEARTGLLVSLAGAGMLFSAIEAVAQNPSFAGKEFRRVWVAGTIPDGATRTPTLSELYLTSAALFYRSGVWENGVYYIDDTGMHTVIRKNDPPLPGAGGFSFMGRMADGGLLFSPISNNNYPCQVFNASGLNAVTAPVEAQRRNLGTYFDGRFVYLQHLGLGQVNIMYYSEGNPPAIWLSNADFSDLATILDYDDETLAFATGTTGAYTLRLRAADGTLTRIIANGESLPGTVVTTYDNAPGSETVEVDQGKVYFLGVGAGYPAPQALFSTTDGSAFDMIAETGQVVPGLSGITITGMVLRQVINGKVWLQVVQSDDETVLYQIVGGVWTRVVGGNDVFDGEAARGLTSFEHGMVGDTVVVALTLPKPGSYSYRTELYVNGDLPGFAAVPSGLAMQIIRELDGSLTVSATGDPGETNSLQATASLTNLIWNAVGTVVADGAGLMEWTLSPTNSARFFRLVE